MLAYLSIENVAVIERADIEFFGGLNVLTGETGAGKSIIIDSINIILGGRISRDIVRTGALKARVSAMFYPSENVWKYLSQLGFEQSDDGSFLVYREISADGRSICRINGQLVPVSSLKDAGRFLINIHGQQDTAVLYSADNHLRLLDSWASSALETELSRYGQYYEKYKKLKKLSDEFDKEKANRSRETEILEFQIREISALNLNSGDEQALAERIEFLKNSEKISEALSSVYNLFAASNENITDMLHTAGSFMNRMKGITPELDEIKESIDDLTYRADDLAITVKNIYSGLEYNENELENLQSRLYEIKKLCTKYKCSGDGLIAFAENAENRLEHLRALDSEINENTAELKQIREKLENSASVLNAIRREYSAALSKEIEKHLSELNMPGAKFSVLFKKTETFTKTGYDAVEFIISPNPGEELKPLSKIASGGELSRIMLALKSIISVYDVTDTYIFDEIDTGISGKTAEKVGLRLRIVSENNQTVIITHSPHIAALADYHYLIEKNTDGKSTKTTVTLLDDNGRIREIARINSGTHITGAALASAKELLDASRK